MCGYDVTYSNFLHQRILDAFRQDTLPALLHGRKEWSQPAADAAAVNAKGLFVTRATS